MADDDGITPLRSEPDFARASEPESAEAVSRRLGLAEEHIRMQLDLINEKLDRMFGLIERKFDDYDYQLKQLNRPAKAAKRK